MHETLAMVSDKVRVCDAYTTVKESRQNIVIHELFFYKFKVAMAVRTTASSKEARLTAGKIAIGRWGASPSSPRQSIRRANVLDAELCSTSGNCRVAESVTAVTMRGTAA